MPLVMDLEIVSGPQRRDLEDEAAVVVRGRWPEFVFHDRISRRYMARVIAGGPGCAVCLGGAPRTDCWTLWMTA
jgi:hypothetical protein